jgi:hypothetical protein
MTCFYQSRGEHRDVNAKNVVISGVESKDLGLPSSVQANDTDSGISQLEYGSQVYEDEERTNRDALEYLQLCNAFLCGFHCAGTICQQSRIQGDIFHSGHLLCMTVLCA